MKIKGLLTYFVFTWVFLMLLASCQTFQYDPELRKASFHQKPTEQSVLNKTFSALVSAQPSDHSGFHILNDGLSAFVARSILIDQAQETLDLQYYIFHGDTSGKIILAKLLQAADRGVRVRLLVDDLGTSFHSPWLAVLNSHPNIQMRTFNPVEARKGVVRALQQAGSFLQTNHRMHNKILIADGVAIIVGGRNIGDEYFSNTKVDFQDLDVIGIGPILKESTEMFDDYWNHILSVPFELLLEPEEGKSLGKLNELATNYLNKTKDTEFANALHQSNLVKQITSGNLNFLWGKSYLYADPPDKAYRKTDVKEYHLLAHYMLQELRKTEQRVQISSAYFVPGEEGMKLFSELTEKGVDVDVLTNSLSTTDVAAVHSGYAGYREPLLEMGVDLWELKSTAEQKQRLKLFSRQSKASLHSKTFVIDNDKSIIGSANFDPRSAQLNTEIALLVKNNQLNSELSELFNKLTNPEAAWKVSLDKNNDLLWSSEEENDQSIILDKEPETTWWTRFKVWLMSILPLEDQI